MISAALFFLVPSHSLLLSLSLKEPVGRCRDSAHGALSKAKPTLQTQHMQPTSVDHPHSLASEVEMDLNRAGTDFMVETLKTNVLHLLKRHNHTEK